MKAANKGQKKSLVRWGLFCLAIVASSIIAFGAMSVNTQGSSFVEENGALTTVGNKVCNQRGNPVQLRGMSSHGICWFGDFVNASCIAWLRDDWKTNCFRIAMYTEATGGLGGYITNQSWNMAKVKEGIDACIEAGVYAIVDWHILADGDPNKYREEAKDFFKQIATEYAEYPNVIYEICNEPNGDNVTWGTITAYANEVIPVIRAADPDSFILVGTPTWSQDVDIAANDPLSFDNVAYVCHFYAGTHGQANRDKVSACLEKGCPVFVSEWGTSDASGSGMVYTTESDTWLSFLDSNKISHVNWSLSDKDESSAALKPGASANGGWSDSDLSTSGTYVRNKLISYCTAEKIKLSPAKLLRLKKYTSSKVTVMVMGDGGCLVAGEVVNARVDTGNRLISITPESQETDEHGQAVFTVTAGRKTGNAKINFESGGKSKSMVVRVVK